MILTVLSLHNYVEAQKIALTFDDNSLPSIDLASYILTPQSIKIRDTLYYQDWKPGILYYPNGSFKDYEKIQYDVRANTIRIQQDNRILNLSPGILTGFAILGNDGSANVFISREVKVSEQSVLSLLEIVVHGKAVLLIGRHAVKLNSGQRNFSEFDMIRFDEKAVKVPDLRTSYYGLGEDGKLRKLKTNKKASLAVMKDQQKPMSAYIKSTVVNWKNLTDLAKLFNHYNSL